MRCRWLLRYMRRHRLLAAYGWVREEGAARAAVCVCALAPRLCMRRERSPATPTFPAAAGRSPESLRTSRWLPYAKPQQAAKRCGLGTLDFRPVFDGAGAAAYVSKYLSKSLGEALGRARRYALSVSIPEIKESGWSWDRRRVALVAVDRLGAVGDRLGCCLLGRPRIIAHKQSCAPIKLRPRGNQSASAASATLGTVDPTRARRLRLPSHR